MSQFSKKTEIQSQSLNRQILSKPLPVRSWIFVQSDYWEKEGGRLREIQHLFLINCVEHRYRAVSYYSRLFHNANSELFFARFWDFWGGEYKAYSMHKHS